MDDPEETMLDATEFAVGVADPKMALEALGAISAGLRYNQEFKERLTLILHRSISRQPR